MARGGVFKFVSTAYPWWHQARQSMGCLIWKVSFRVLYTNVIDPSLFSRGHTSILSSWTFNYSSRSDASRFQHIQDDAVRTEIEGSRPSQHLVRINLVIRQSRTQEPRRQFSVVRCCPVTPNSARFRCVSTLKCSQQCMVEKELAE